jgi:putative transposase
VSAPHAASRRPCQEVADVLTESPRGDVAFDFFTVPTVTFRLLYCFFAIEHGRRRILRFNVTDHSTAEWVVQQLREAFPEAGLIDMPSSIDSTFSEEVVMFLEATGLKSKRTSVQAPWQNGVAERWIGSARRELL